MFLLNSCLSLFSAAALARHPFSRSYGVILPSSLTMLLPPALDSLPSPVSVYGTGTYEHSGFSRRRLPCFPTLFRSASRLWLVQGFPPHAPALAPASFPGSRLPHVPTVSVIRSTGISTCCPSATRPRLALGPDLPRADQLYPGNLGYSAGGFPPFLSLLIPAFSLPALHCALRHASSRSQCSSTNASRHSRASAACFSPGHFRRRTSRPVSYYALFECVAASEPTSWLSLKSHILFHLTRTSGP